MPSPGLQRKVLTEHPGLGVCRIGWTPNLAHFASGRILGDTLSMLRAVTVFRTAALAGVGLLAGQYLLAVLEPVPKLDEYDASGIVGSGPLNRRWLAVGDSTTTGAGLTGPDEIWIRQLATRFSGSTEILSLALGGATASSVLRDQVPRMNGRFDVAFLAVGSNDALRGVPASVFRRRLQEIVRHLQHHAGAIVVMGVGDLGTIPRLRRPLSRLMALYGAKLDSAAAEVSAAANLLKVDHCQYADHFSDPSIFSLDRFHPTATGHRLWADAVEGTLRHAGVT